MSRELFTRCNHLVRGRTCRNPGSWTYDGFHYCKRHYEKRKQWWERGQRNTVNRGVK